MFTPIRAGVVPANAKCKHILNAGSYLHGHISGRTWLRLLVLRFVEAASGTGRRLSVHRSANGCIDCMGMVG